MLECSSKAKISFLFGENLFGKRCILRSANWIREIFNLSSDTHVVFYKRVYAEQQLKMDLVNSVPSIVIIISPLNALMHD